MIFEGVCLEPDIADGACLLFDKNVPYKRGDFVILFRRPELVKPGQHQAIVKRLYMVPPAWVTFPYRDHPNSDVRALIIAEQLNPHLQFAIPCEDLLAIFQMSRTCLGLVPEGMPAKRVSETEACTDAPRQEALTIGGKHVSASTAHASCKPLAPRRNGASPLSAAPIASGSPRRCASEWKRAKEPRARREQNIGLPLRSCPADETVASPVRAPVAIAEPVHLPAWLVQVKRNVKFRVLYTRSSGRLAGSFGA